MVLKNLDNRKRAYLTLGIFVALALIFWYFGDSFSAWISGINPWIALVLNILINPAYLVLIYVLYTEYDGRGIFAGILISLAVDIISLTHSVSKLGGAIPTGPLSGYSDTTFYKILYPLTHSQFAVFFLYVILPSLLVYLAFRIIRRSASFNKIFRESI